MLKNDACHLLPKPRDDESFGAGEDEVAVEGIPDDALMEISDALIKRNRHVYEELAK